MHKHIRLMCGTSLHIQSCCAFCLQGSAEAEAFKSHMIYYTAKCWGEQMKAVLDGGGGLTQSVCVSPSLTSVLELLL